METTYRVAVERNRLKFAAAHMATFTGDLEPLHGHNYALFIEVTGGLTQDSWVIDFGQLKRIGRDICGALDHKFLLQGASSLLSVDRGDEVRVGFRDRSYVFPKRDVIDLPVDNTTAERLAEWIGGQVLEALRQAGATNIVKLRVGLEEAPGQSGWWESNL
ncbi:MAG TPA: 6-carboxytetrahydropterin synthase [Dehalococcoidia bacterium]|nr:6-carboxytetrahydropterin synthase [Dehalococcoidia bacterium]